MLGMNSERWTLNNEEKAHIRTDVAEEGGAVHRVGRLEHNWRQEDVLVEVGREVHLPLQARRQQAEQQAERHHRQAVRSAQYTVLYYCTCTH